MYTLQQSVRVLLTLFTGLMLTAAPAKPSDSEDNITYNIKPSRSGEELR